MRAGLDPLSSSNSNLRHDSHLVDDENSTVSFSFEQATMREIKKQKTDQQFIGSIGSPSRGQLNTHFCSAKKEAAVVLPDPSEEDETRSTKANLQAEFSQ